MRLAKWTCPCSLLLPARRHSETDMRMNNLTITSYIHTCETQTSSLRANSHVFLFNVQIKREKPELSLRWWMKRSIVILCVLLKCFWKYFTVHRCLFVWLSSNYSMQPAHWAAPGASGDGCQRSRTCKPCKSPHFTGFHTNSWCISCARVRKHFLSAGTICRHPLPPPSPSQTYNILSLPSSPRSLVADLHPRSPQAWPSMATTFTLVFFLPSAHSRPAWSAQKHSR